MNDIQKNVLITGASSGIGRQVAYQLAKQNTNLVLCARRYEELKIVKERCKKLGANRVDIFYLDLASQASIELLMKELNMLGIKINVLINNAGFGHSARFVETNIETINNLFRVNVTGLMYLTQNIVKNMLKNEQEYKQIINVASMAGKVSTPKFSIYAATKAALINFSNALRLELKEKNIQVTVVNFGPVNTPFFDKIDGDRKAKGQNGLFTLSEQKAAKFIIKTIGTKKREINRPIILSISEKLYRLFPNISDYFLKKYYRD